MSDKLETYEKILSLASSGAKPQRFAKDTQYVGIRMKRKTDRGHEQELSLEVFWGRPYSVHEFDTIHQVYSYTSGIYSAAITALFYEAAQSGRKPCRTGSLEADQTYHVFQVPI